MVLSVLFAIFFSVLNIKKESQLPLPPIPLEVVNAEVLDTATMDQMREQLEAMGANNTNTEGVDPADSTESTE